MLSGSVKSEARFKVELHDGRYGFRAVLHPPESTADLVHLSTVMTRIEVNHSMFIVFHTVLVRQKCSSTRIRMCRRFARPLRGRPPRSECLRRSA